MLTVKQLIDILRTFPEDATVLGYEGELTGISIVSPTSSGSGFIVARQDDDDYKTKSGEVERY